MGVLECCDVNTGRRKKTLAQRISGSTEAVRRSETSKSSMSAEEPRSKELRPGGRKKVLGSTFVPKRFNAPPPPPPHHHPPTDLFKNSGTVQMFSQRPTAHFH